VLEVSRRVLGDEHQDTQDAMNELVFLGEMQGKFAEAEQLLTRLVDVNRRVLGDEHFNRLKSMNHLAATYQAQREYAKAESLLTRVLEVRNRVQGEENPIVLITMNDLGRVYVFQRRYAQAEELYTKVLEVDRRVLGPRHLNTLEAMTTLAAVYLDESKHKQAEGLLREALTSYEKAAPQAMSRYHSQSLLGASLVGQEKYAEAESLVISGYEGMLQLAVANRCECRSTLKPAVAWIVQLYTDWGKPDRAAMWTQKLRELSADVQ
jgi:tetratricopeptide (TPR) repeat protein